MRLVSFSAALLIIAGCTFDTSGAGGGNTAFDATTGDGANNRDGFSPADAAPRVDANCADFASTYVDVCSLGAPMGDLTLTGGTFGYDTDNGQWDTVVPAHTTIRVAQIGSGPMVRVIVVNNFAIESDAALHAEGPDPLVIVAYGTIRIDGLLDVASDDAGPGAGANAMAECGPPPVKGSDNNGGSGGGGGAGLGAGGGNGGTGLASGGTGSAAKLAPLTLIHGGCRGANGGSGGSGANGEASGGNGGGAVQLISVAAVDIAGVVHAGGDAGAFGFNDGGGAGGGSGGYIGIEAANLSLAASGVLAANGGGGGEGANDSAVGNAGEPGRDDNIPAAGGEGTIGGGNGGDGGAEGTGAASGAGSGDGAGGGGGSVGYIIVRAATTINIAATVTPAVTTP